MKKNLFSRFISLVLTTIMIMGLLPTIGVMAADEPIAAISKDGVSFRLAVVSDSHLGATAAEPYNNLTKALNYFDTIGGVDALAMNGDMVYAPAASSVTSGMYTYNGAEVAIPADLYNGLKGALAAHNSGNDSAGTDYTLAGTQNSETSVFTADTSSGAKPIIYAMGNHGYPENDRDTTRGAAAKQLFTDATGRASRHIMKVGGYTFVMGDALDFFNDYTGSEEFVKTQILAAEAADTSNKPIFLLQHEPVFGTVEGSDSSPNRNTQEFKDFLNAHPRVVVLSAHTHVAENDPRTIWQDGFTAMSTAQLGGGNIAGDGAKYNMGAQSTGSQCMMIDLTEKTNATDVKVYRINVLTGKMIGEPYTFTIDGTKNETFRYGTPNVTDDIISKASYPENTTLEVTKEARQGFTFNLKANAAVTEGSADYLQDDFVHSYKVIVKNNDADCVVQNFRVMGDFYEADNTRLSSYSVEIPNQLGRNINYTISVYALTPFMADYTVDQLKSSGITPAIYTFTTSSEMTDADKALMSTRNINVAAGKTVIAGNPNRTNASNLVNGVYNEYISPAEYPESGTKITLPSGTQVNAATSNANDWFIVDLGRRYDITEVKVWPRGDNSLNQVYMQNFVIEASNNVDAATWNKLGGVGTTDAPSDYTPVVGEGDGNAYRYIRLRKTEVTYHIYGELEVFADVELFEASRKKTVHSNYTSSTYPVSNIVDGSTNDSNDFWYVSGWYSNSSNPIPYAVVDLEADVPVSLIQMYARRTIVSGAMPNSHWEAYGFTNAQSDLINSESFDPTTGTKLLAPEQSNFPLNLAANDPNNYYEKALNGTAYRYIVFRKTYYNVQLAEVKIFNINDDAAPQVTKVVNEDGKVVVSFSEVMDADTIKAENFTFSDTTAVISAPVLSTGYDGGYEVTFTVTGTQPTGTLTVSNVATPKGTAMTGAQTLKLGDINISIDKQYSAVRENVNVAFGKTVIPGNPNHSSATAAKMVNGSYSDVIHADDGSNTDGSYTAGTVALPSGTLTDCATHQQNDWFIIDLGRRYNVSQVKVWPRNDTYAKEFMQYFDIEASNVEDFETYATLGGVKTDAPEDSSTAVTVNGDGNAYRYIRLKRTGNTSYGYSEIEVYADLTATEVSRNASVSASKNYSTSYPATKAVDGVTETSYQMWLVENNTEPVWLTVDLAKEYPVEYIEMYDTNHANNPAHRSNWSIYGFKAAESGLLTTPTSGTKLMPDTGWDPGYFPVHVSNANAHLAVTAPISTMSRYIVFYKANYNLGINEVRACVINPVAYSARVNGDGTITVSFTDKMQASSVTEDKFTIDGVTLSNPVVADGWDGGYDVTFDYDGIIADGMELTIDETVRSENGIEMAADTTITIDADIFMVSVDGSKVDEIVAGSEHSAEAIFLPEEDATVILYVAVKSGDTLVDYAKSEAIEVTAGTAVKLVATTNVTPKTGEIVEFYLWDANRKPIVLKEILR